jgi:hypothetical protein
MRYRTHALILAAFAVTLGGLAAQTQKNGVGKVEAAAAPTAATSANFCRIHRSLRVTPAVEAGVANHVWDLAELLA